RRDVVGSVHRVCFFFFSSRRRHTRFSRDWSSDVCSSDLPAGRFGSVAPRAVAAPNLPAGGAFAAAGGPAAGTQLYVMHPDGGERSEERRVGKEWRSRWGRDDEQKRHDERVKERGFVGYRV